MKNCRFVIAGVFSIIIAFGQIAHAQFYELNGGDRPANPNATATKATSLSKGQLELLERFREANMAYQKKKASEPGPTQGFIFLDENSINRGHEAADIIRDARQRGGDIQLIVSAPEDNFPEIVKMMHKQVTDSSIQWQFDANMEKANYFGVKSFPASGLLWKGKPRLLQQWDSWNQVLNIIGHFGNPNKLDKSQIPSVPPQGRPVGLGSE